MASHNDHVTDGHHNNTTLQTPHLHQRILPNENSRQREIIPASVEEVIHLGYSPDLVISVHRQLLSSICDDHSNSQNAVSTSGNGPTNHMPGSSISRDVSASRLLAAVDEAMRGSNVGDFTESDQQFAFGFQNSAVVLSPAEETSSTGASVGLTMEETEDGMEAFQDAGAVPNMSSAMEASPAVAHSIPLAGTIANMSSAMAASPDAVAHSIPHAGNTSIHRIQISASGSATDSSTLLQPSSTSPESLTTSHENNVSDANAARERRLLLEKLQALREENRRLKDRKSCSHCRQRPVSLTLLPCGHFTLCEECGSSFKACPVCQQTILADVKTYLS